MSSEIWEVHPTRAEWLIAARGPNRNATKYFWGDLPGKNNANCIDDECGEDFKNTSPVGWFQPNGYGIYDTSGNVSEWVSVCFNWKYFFSLHESNNFGCDVSNAVGGSWVDTAEDILENYQEFGEGYNLDSEYRSNFIGFRLVEEY